MNLTIGQKINIPAHCVAPALHGLLNDAEVVAFRHSPIDGKMVILKTREPWQAAQNWPLHETIGLSIRSLTA